MILFEFGGVRKTFKKVKKFKMEDSKLGQLWHMLYHICQYDNRNLSKPSLVTISKHLKLFSFFFLFNCNL